ncbi:hypothetical protein STENM327S_02880 [Streptomyces tendae]
MAAFNAIFNSGLGRGCTYSHQDASWPRSPDPARGPPAADAPDARAARLEMAQEGGTRRAADLIEAELAAARG